MQYAVFLSAHSLFFREVCPLLPLSPFPSLPHSPFVTTKPPPPPTAPELSTQPKTPTPKPPPHFLPPPPEQAKTPNEEEIARSSTLSGNKGQVVTLPRPHAHTRDPLASRHCPIPPPPPRTCTLLTANSHPLYNSKIYGSPQQGGLPKTPPRAQPHQPPQNEQPSPLPYGSEANIRRTPRKIPTPPPHTHSRTSLCLTHLCLTLFSPTEDHFFHKRTDAPPNTGLTQASVRNVRSNSLTHPPPPPPSRTSPSAPHTTPPPVP